MPRFGGFFFTVFMSMGLHFHLVFLKDKPEALGLQFTLYAAGIIVMLFGGVGSAPPPKAKTK